MLTNGLHNPGLFPSHYDYHNNRVLLIMAMPAWWLLPIGKVEYITKGAEFIFYLTIFLPLVNNDVNI